MSAIRQHDTIINITPPNNVINPVIHAGKIDHGSSTWANHALIHTPPIDITAPMITNKIYANSFISYSFPDGGADL
jgi:hypothetical protein